MSSAATQMDLEGTMLSEAESRKDTLHVISPKRTKKHRKTETDMESKLLVARGKRARHR